jgi:hypothetical protein
MEKKIEDVIRQFRTQGIELERQSISYSFVQAEKIRLNQFLVIGKHIDAIRGFVDTENAVILGFFCRFNT